MSLTFPGPLARIFDSLLFAHSIAGSPVASWSSVWLELWNFIGHDVSRRARGYPPHYFARYFT